MFACICYAVSEDEVTAAVHDGAASIEEIGDRTDAGTCCGTCHDRLAGILDHRCGGCPLAGLRVA